MLFKMLRAIFDGNKTSKEHREAHRFHQLNTNKFTISIACFMIDGIKTVIKLHFEPIK